MCLAGKFRCGLLFDRLTSVIFWSALICSCMHRSSLSTSGGTRMCPDSICLWPSPLILSCNGCGWLWAINCRSGSLTTSIGWSSIICFCSRIILRLIIVIYNDFGFLNTEIRWLALFTYSSCLIIRWFLNQFNILFNFYRALKISWDATYSVFGCCWWTPYLIIISISDQGLCGCPCHRFLSVLLL